ncbi:MAG: 8-amino-7-oxononanoate synthase [Gammaproteobacteria bacterium]|nr:MAG: 8-amino-7-oxononanoate synthase [Gammaproteobacteria bacterium]
MSIWQRRLAERLAARQKQHLYRRRLSLESAQGVTVRIDGEPILNFCSNDYLGLAAHPRITDALVEGAKRYGVGSGSSHLVCGHSAAHEQLEQALARATGRSRALLFGSGYQANSSVLAALLQRGDVVLQDRLNHASLIDGALLCGATLKRFKHNDTGELRTRLQTHAPDKAAMLAVDGVFSMDGDIAPLSQYASICREHDALLMVDDAHGFGVLGEGGAGSVADAGLSEQDVPVLMVTLGKALGTVGAVVAGSEKLIENLIQFARGYVYSTALPPALAVASLEALAVMQEEAWRRDHLQALIQQCREAAQSFALPFMTSTTAIQPLLVGDAARALELSAALRARGFLVQAIRPPTVPAGSARLRITLTAAHSEAQVTQLMEALRDVWYD